MGMDAGHAMPESAINAPSQESAQVYPNFHIGGFSDITVAGAGASPNTGFQLGQFVLHMTSALAPTVNFFGELTLSARTDAGQGTPPATGYNAEVERVIIQFNESDALRASFGRYHTPINWWNTAFHHGLWLQTTISRPEMVKFGGQFIPPHFVGALAEGVFPADGINLHYNAGLGNGRGPVVSRADDAGNVNNSKIATLLNLFVKPNRFYPLEVGGAIYHDEIKLLNASEFREYIETAHIVWPKETPELIAEYARVNHMEIRGPTRNSEAYYFQAAYRLPWFNHRLKPYWRYERISIPVSDPVFSGTPSLQGHLVGARYELADLVALKVEYRNLKRNTAPGITGLYGQISYAF